MGDVTLRKALEDYKNVYMTYRNFADRSRVEYLNDLEDLVGFLEKSGIRQVTKLELAQIERYLANLERRGFASATRKRKTVAIRSFLKFLYQDQYISSNLAKHVIPPFVENKTPSFLTEAEYNRLRKVCASNARDTAIIELLLQTGIKLSELTRLIHDDVEVQDDGGSIRIKGGRSREERTLPLNSKATQAVSAYLNERQGSDIPILFLNRFGEPLGDRGVQKMLKKYLKKAGIGRASVQTLRHTFGIHHAVEGTSVKTLQEVMGHKDVRSTSSYFSLAKEVVRKEIQENAL
jgi:site-specific recombinase XerD